jgi:hypothetical protein
MRILLASLCLFLIIPAYASVIVGAGVTQIAPPPSIMPGQLLSDSTIYLFNEQVDLTLASAVSVGISEPGVYIVGTSTFTPATIAAGVTVNSYLLRAAPATNPTGQDYRDFTGTISFSNGEKILGIIIGIDNIAGTAGTLGSPTTLYPPSSCTACGLENTDEVILSANGESVFVNFHVNAATEGMDMIRIITSGPTTTPEPADYLLMGSGLAVVAFLKRRTLARRVFQR